MGEHAQEHRERHRRDAEVRRFFATASGLELLEHAFSYGSGKEFDARWKRLTPSERMQPEACELRVSDRIRRGRTSEAEQLLARSPEFLGKARLKLLLALVGRGIWLDSIVWLRPEGCFGTECLEESEDLTVNEAFDIAKSDREMLKQLWLEALDESDGMSGDADSPTMLDGFLPEVGRWLDADEI